LTHRSGFGDRFDAQYRSSRRRRVNHVALGVAGERDQVRALAVELGLAGFFVDADDRVVDASQIGVLGIFGDKALGVIDRPALLAVRVAGGLVECDHASIRQNLVYAVGGDGGGIDQRNAGIVSPLDPAGGDVETIKLGVGGGDVQAGVVGFQIGDDSPVG